MTIWITSDCKGALGVDNASAGAPETSTPGWIAPRGMVTTTKSSSTTTTEESGDAIAPFGVGEDVSVAVLKGTL